MKKYLLPVLTFFIFANLLYAQNNSQPGGQQGETSNQLFRTVGRIQIPPASDSKANSGIVDIPMTTSILQEVGVEKISQFQCYISKAFSLRLVLERLETTIEGGHLIRRNLTAREQISLSENLPGIVRAYQPRGKNEYQLNIAFENYDGNPVVSFGANLSGESEKYYMLFNDYSRRVIRYGNDDYLVSYDGEEPPYILIKMKQSSEEINTARRASGLILGE